MTDLSGIAAEAEQILNNKAHRRACELLEKEIVDRLMRVEFDGSLDKERYREKLNLMLQVHARYKKILASMIMSGRIEAGTLERRSLLNRKGM